MTNAQRNHLRRRIPLLTYLKQQGWKPAAYSERDEVYGKCPLHFESRPSFYVNRRKDVFFCHGCGQGGDVIRLAQLLHGVDFRGALAALSQQAGQQLWIDACAFYQAQLLNSSEAQDYLRSRGIAAETAARLGIGYAPGGCLRGYLEELGYTRQAIAESGLTDSQGRDRFRRAITFPLPETANVYARSIELTSQRHCFLARSKGGLYGWEQARHCQQLIVVEGLFDLASLWQAGFTNTVALLGSHFTTRQLAQLADGRPRTVYLCLDEDANQSGQRAARWWRMRLEQAGMRAAQLQLPAGYDPNRFFAEGGSAEWFAQLLGEAGQ